MPSAPHLFIGVFDTPPAREALAHGIARQLRIGISSAGPSVFQPLPGQPLPEDPRDWADGLPGVRGRVTAKAPCLPPATPDMVVAVRLRGGRAAARLEIFVLSPCGEVIARHCGTATSPSLIACIARAMASANRHGALGIPEVFTLPDLVASMASAETPTKALRNLEAKGRELMAHARSLEPRERFVGLSAA